MSHKLTWSLISLFGLILLLLCWQLLQPSDDLPETVSFNQHIRPLLSQNCYLCHGPDSSSREADIRLDTREWATHVREDGTAAIVPGDPDESLIIQRIAHQDPEERMPPEKTNKILSAREIGLLRKWIDQGATWEQHWAFVLPKASRISDTEHPIDQFIQDKQEEHGLEAAPESTPNLLIRRLSYLLTGLPPAPERVRQFEEAYSEEAYEQLVDEYLDSPHFGEKWARHWMDLMRYAETRGHEFDYPIGGAWRYRDYLIRAFNQDVAYDQLVMEHLAGDLIEEPRLHPETGIDESVIGTVSFTLSEGKHSPVDLIEDEAERIDNIIDVTTKSFQALTVGCARCHDHKFDPIPTTDYYSLYGILKSTRFTPRAASQTQKVQQSIERLAQLRTKLRKAVGQSWEDELPLAQQARADDVQVPILPVEDSSWYVLGDFRLGHWEGWFSEGVGFGEKPVLGELMMNQDSSRIIGLAEGKASSRRLGNGTQGVLRSPNFVIDKDTIAVRAIGKFATLRVVIDNHQLIQDPIYGELDMEVNDETWKLYKFPLTPYKGHTAYVEIIPGRYRTRQLAHQYQLKPDSYIEVAYVIAYDQRYPDMRLRFPSLPPVYEVLERWTNGEAQPADVERLNQELSNARFNDMTEILMPIWEQQKKLAQLAYDSTHISSVTEGNAIYSPVFIRGSSKSQSEERVPHRFFAALGGEKAPFTETASGRLELAKAITDPANPLTARVMVNRIWHHLFGRGIVETVDNFGVQGKLPTHPELLDHLALEFMESGWSVKHIIRSIVLSETFKQTTQASEQASMLDPQNLWLSHFPIRRLEAESIRDGLLAVSGRLDSSMYGEPVPIYLTEFVKGRGRPRETGPLDGAGRRSIYLSIRRNFLIPMMLVFDQPVPFSTFGKRNLSNVPAQSLTLMNDPFVIGQATYWAEQMLQDYSVPEERIRAMYATAFSRIPTDQELQNGLTFIQEQAHAYGCEEALHELQPWQDFAHALINSKEFIFLL